MLDLLNKGGWVMYVILGCSVVTVAVVLERAVFFLRLGTEEGLAARVIGALRSGGKEEALGACEGRGPVASALRACLGLSAKGRSRKELEEAARQAASVPLAEMENHLRALAVVAQAAPLLGLLGTVLGMIRAFMKVEQTGGRAGARALAGGIWEALLTTAFGLMVAITAMLFYHYFAALVDRRQKRMERALVQLLEELDR